MVLENMNTDTHKLLLKNESLVSGAVESSHQSPERDSSFKVGTQPAESQIVKDHL